MHRCEKGKGGKGMFQSIVHAASFGFKVGAYLVGVFLTEGYWMERYRRQTEPPFRITDNRILFFTFLWPVAWPAKWIWSFLCRRSWDKFPRAVGTFLISALTSAGGAGLRFLDRLEKLGATLAAKSLASEPSES